MRGLIFDMDGVLVDSTPIIWEAFNTILSEDYGVTITDKEIQKYTGRSLRDQIKMWQEDYDIDGEINLDDFASRAVEIEKKLLEEELGPNEVAKNLIRQAKKEGIKVGVATSSTRGRAMDFLEALGIIPLADSIVTAEDLEKHKPNPEIFLDSAKNMGVDPSGCVVIEDAPNGIEAANRAGMKTVAVVTKFHTADEFSEEDLIIESLSELTVIKLKGLFG